MEHIDLSPQVALILGNLNSFLSMKRLKVSDAAFNSATTVGLFIRDITNFLRSKERRGPSKTEGVAPARVSADVGQAAFDFSFNRDGIGTVKI